MYYDFGVFPSSHTQSKATVAVPPTESLHVQTSVCEPVGDGAASGDPSPVARITRSSVSSKAVPILSSSPGVAYVPHGDTISANTINAGDLALRGLTSSASPDSVTASKGTWFFLPAAAVLKSRRVLCCSTVLTHTNLIPSVVALAWTYQSLLVNHVDTVDSTQCRDPALLRIRYVSSSVLPRLQLVAVTVNALQCRYYTKGDWSLKHFLESRCFDPTGLCSHCRRPNHRHVISYSHLKFDSCFKRRVNSVCPFIVPHASFELSVAEWRSTC